MDELSIVHLQELCKGGQIIWTDHVMKRLSLRNISRADVKSCIMNGEIIEQYPKDYPYPSCLIYGTTIHNTILHVVVGDGENKLWIITAYWPDPNQWDKSLKIRKEQ